MQRLIVPNANIHYFEIDQTTCLFSSPDSTKTLVTLDEQRPHSDPIDVKILSTLPKGWEILARPYPPNPYYLEVFSYHKIREEKEIQQTTEKEKGKEKEGDIRKSAEIEDEEIIVEDQDKKLILSGYILKSDAKPLKVPFNKVKGSIFPEDKLTLDPQERELANCFLFPYLFAILSQPHGEDFIRNMMQQKGKYTSVTLYDPDTLEPFQIQVENSYYCENAKKQPELAPWVYILAKAIIAAIFARKETSLFSFKNAKQASQLIFKILTGREPETKEIDNKKLKNLYDDLQKLLAENDKKNYPILIFSTRDDLPKNEKNKDLMPSHIYSFIGFEHLEDPQEILLRFGNPLGEKRSLCFKSNTENSPFFQGDPVKEMHVFTVKLDAIPDHFTSYTTAKFSLPQLNKAGKEKKTSTEKPQDGFFRRHYPKFIIATTLFSFCALAGIVGVLVFLMIATITCIAMAMQKSEPEPPTQDIESSPAPSISSSRQNNTEDAKIENQPRVPLCQSPSPNRKKVSGKTLPKNYTQRVRVSTSRDALTSHIGGQTPTMPGAMPDVPVTNTTPTNSNI